MATEADKLIAAWTEARDRIKLVTDNDLMDAKKAAKASSALLKLYAPAASAAREAAAFVAATSDAAVNEYGITGAGGVARALFVPSVEASANAASWLTQPGSTYRYAGVNVLDLPDGPRARAYRDELLSHCAQILDSLRVPKAHLDSIYHAVASWILKAVNAVIKFVEAVVAAVGEIIGAVAEVFRAIGTAIGTGANIFGKLVGAVPWLAAGAVVFLGGRWAYRRGKRVWHGGPLLTRKKRGSGGVAGIFSPSADKSIIDAMEKRIEETARRDRTSLSVAAVKVARRDPRAAADVLDLIGFWPSSTPALRALQVEAPQALPGLR